MFILIYKDGITKNETLLGTFPSRSGEFRIEPTPEEYTLQQSLDPLEMTDVTEIFPNLTRLETEQIESSESEGNGVVTVEASGFSPKNREQIVYVTGLNLDKAGFYISNKHGRGIYRGKRENPEVPNHHYELLTGKIRNPGEYRRVRGLEPRRRGLGYKMKRCVVGWEPREYTPENNGHTLRGKEVL